MYTYEALYTATRMPAFVTGKNNPDSMRRMVCVIDTDTSMSLCHV